MGVSDAIASAFMHLPFYPMMWQYIDWIIHIRTSHGKTYIQSRTVILGAFAQYAKHCNISVAFKLVNRSKMIEIRVKSNQQGNKSLPGRGACSAVAIHQGYSRNKIVAFPVKQNTSRSSAPWSSLLEARHEAWPPNSANWLVVQAGFSNTPHTSPHHITPCLSCARIRPAKSCPSLVGSDRTSCPHTWIGVRFLLVVFWWAKKHKGSHGSHRPKLFCPRFLQTHKLIISCCIMLYRPMLSGKDGRIRIVAIPWVLKACTSLV